MQGYHKGIVSVMCSHGILYFFLNIAFKSLEFATYFLMKIRVKVYLGQN